MPARKVLIVDDDPLARRILHSALTTEGYEATVAADAMTALSEAQRIRPDIILLDLGLPAGGGMSFLARMRRFPNLAVVPVIVISGHDRTLAEKPALEAGAAAFLQKPARPEQVIAEMNRILG